MLTGDILSASTARWPDRAAIIHDKTRLSYRAFDAAANRFAHALIDSGLNPGDRIAILCSNRPEYAIAYFGAARAGAVSAHLSTRYLSHEIAHALRLVEARFAIAEDGLAGIVAGLGDSVPELRRVIVVGEGPGDFRFDEFVEGKPETDPGLSLKPEDPGSITFTGGTTGLPKGTLLTHRARTCWARTGVHDFGLSENDVNIVAAPMYHAAGGFIWFQPTVMAGGACVLMSRWDVPGFISRVERDGGTGAFMVPAQIVMLLNDPAFDATRLTSLRKLVYGAAAAPPSLLERAERALPGVDFIQNFGQTETGPLITLKPEDRHRHPDALGYASELVEAAIFTEPGRRAEPGEIGEIAARGAHLMREYVADPQETANFFRGGDGWGFTGDLARADPDGLITLVGRAGELMICGGVNVFPAEIENVIAEHPAVAECAAFAIPDKKWGELPMAAVVARPGQDVTPETLLDFCEGRIARHKRPRRVELVESLPRSSAGKIQRGALRDRFG